MENRNQFLIFFFFSLLLFMNGLNAQDFTWSEINLQQGYEEMPQPIFELAKFVQENGKPTRAQSKQFNVATRVDGKIFLEIQCGFDVEVKPALKPETLTFFEKETEYKNVVGGWVEAGDIFSLYQTLEEPYFMLASIPAIISQTGDTVTNATSYMNNVLGGLGLKVAIFEPFYGGIYSSQAAGKVPTPFYEHDFSSSGDPFDDGDVHGTGVTEIIYHFAPQAEFHLYKFATPTQFSAAMQDAIAEGIDVISLSLGFPNTGWADGTGVPNMAVKDATDAGIIVFSAAGNNQKYHWQGHFDDGAQIDGDHVWDGSVDEGNDIDVPNGKTLACHLQWKGTPTANNDFNLRFFNAITGVLLASNTATVGPASLNWTNTTGSLLKVAVVVNRLNSTQTEFELFAVNTGGYQLQYNSTGNSIIAPSTSGEDLSIIVGAVARENYDGPITYVESYSSRGPSNSGRILPDIVAPTNLVNYSYPSGMSGTSAAAPCAAGIALLLWSEHDYLSAEGLIDVIYGLTKLYNHWTIGGVEQDNEWGRGGIELPNYTANSRFIIEGVTNNNDLDRPFDKVERADYLSPQDLNLFFLGGTYGPPNNAQDVLDKPMIYRSLKENALIEAN